MTRAPAMGMMMVTVFGLGRLRPASGTWGSLPPVAAAGLLWAGGAPWWAWWGAMGALVIVFSIACVMFGDWAEAEFGKKDPGQVVADETAGMALTLMFLPWGWTGTWAAGAAWLAGAFLLFRAMDIIKPPPARGLQRLPSGWGILVDDLLAGVYAGALWWALRWVAGAL
ncbi:MAG: phosphatidylglycerophosphatase A [Phycisphaerales bacterium]